VHDVRPADDCERLSAGLSDCGTSLPPQDAVTADRRKPRLCLGCAFGLRIDRSAKWTKAMDGFVHNQLCSGLRVGGSIPLRPARLLAAASGKADAPRFLRAIALRAG
jgi:hypothetical protein